MGKKILFVDNEKILLNSYREYFEGKGFTVFTAVTGTEALEVVKNHLFPTIFLDLQMPKMDGVELCREIRKVNPSAWISAVSGQWSLFEIKQCNEAGFNGYFAKPPRLEDLLETAERAFDKFKDT